MKQLLILALPVLFLCSCQMGTEVWINKDGSGQQEFVMDMSGMGAMAGLLDGAMDENGEKAVEEKLMDNMDNNMNQETIKDILEGEKKPINISDLLNNPMSMGDVDTSFIVYDAMPDSLKSHPLAELAKQMYFKIKANESEETMRIHMGIKYDNDKEFKEVSTAFGEMMALMDEKKGGTASGGGQKDFTKATEIFNKDYQVDTKRGIVIIPEQDMSESLGDIGGPMGDEEINFDDPQQKMMFEMMFGDSGYSATYHLPGEIEFTNQLNATIDGNKVTFFTPMIELMEMQKTSKIIIKYKS